MSREVALVPIPNDKGVHTKSAGAKGEKYVYKYVRYFRNQNGKPRNQAKMIGKVSSQSGMMIPNENYFALYHTNVSYPDLTVWDYGYTWLALYVCQSMGLTKILNHIFGERAEVILSMVCYILLEGNRMDGMPIWQERNYLPWASQPYYLAELSQVFASICSEERDAFFREWIAANPDIRHVCYGISSFSSYSDSIPDLGRRSHRDRENPSQFNLSIFCDEGTRIPIYYNRDHGSLPGCLADAESMGIHKIHIALDREVWSEEAVRYLQSNCGTFTMEMPVSLKESRTAIEHCRDKIEAVAKDLSDSSPPCTSESASLYGVDGRILVYYDPVNHAGLCRDLSADIARVEAELQECKHYPQSELDHFSRYFILTKDLEGSGFQFQKDLDKIEQLRREKGYLLLFTNDMNSSPKDILSFYRARNVGEELFSQISNDPESCQVSTLEEKTADGKLFVIFLACVIKTYMVNTLQRSRKEDTVSLKNVFAQLSNIMMIEESGGKRLAKAVTRKQREILQLFNAYDALLRSLS